MTTDWLKSRKLLCIRLDNLGDVIMTTPAMRALKESIPGVSLTLLTSQSGAQATALIPQLDDVIIYEAPWMKATSPRRNSAADWKLIERLRRSGIWDELPEALRETADLRCENPELSLSEMCLLFDPPLSRSGLNNRMKKLMKLAEEIT